MRKSPVPLPGGPICLIHRVVVPIARIKTFRCTCRYAYVVSLCFNTSPPSPHTLTRRLKYQTLRLCGTRLSSEEGAQLTALARKVGGSIAGRKWDARCTHLICPSVATIVTEKLVLALAEGVRRKKRGGGGDRLIPLVINMCWQSVDENAHCQFESRIQGLGQFRTNLQRSEHVEFPKASYGVTFSETQF